MRVRRIKPGTIDEWIGQMIEEGRSRSVIVETLGVLRRILNRAVRDKVIPSNPCAERGLQLPRKQQVERPVLSPAEVEKIAKHAGTSATRCSSASWHTLVVGSARRSHFAGHHWTSSDALSRSARTSPATRASPYCVQPRHTRHEPSTSPAGLPSSCVTIAVKVLLAMSRRWYFRTSSVATCNTGTGGGTGILRPNKRGSDQGSTARPSSHLCVSAHRRGCITQRRSAAHGPLIDRGNDECGREDSRRPVRGPRCAARRVDRPGGLTSPRSEHPSWDYM